MGTNSMFFIAEHHVYIFGLHKHSKMRMCTNFGDLKTIYIRSNVQRPAIVSTIARKYKSVAFNAFLHGFPGVTMRILRFSATNFRWRKLPKCRCGIQSIYTLPHSFVTGKLASKIVTTPILWQFILIEKMSTAFKIACYNIVTWHNRKREKSDCLEIIILA